VGRKTANVLLGNAFGIPGIVVDTHVRRVSQRIGLTKNDDPVKIEFDLMEIVPKEEWTHFSNLLVWHGRKTCTARKPLCDKCAIRKWCDYGTKSNPNNQIITNDQNAPHPSPLPRGERDGVRGLEFW
jgi:endonuclease-3